MFIHMYTSWFGIELYREGEDFVAWTKDSPERPEGAQIHISLPEHAVGLYDEESGEFVIKPKSDW